MNRIVSAAIGTAVVLSLALGAAFAQVGTPAPGMMTPNDVWVQNRGDAEAVPVSIQSVSPNAPPLRVQLAGGPASPQMQMARQLWEYLSIRIAPGQDGTAALNTAGADGWEATGAVLVVQGGGVVVLMKRPRSDAGPTAAH